jgi:hypothetical protein
MSGFLSAYDGVERIELGRGYWVDVKQCLSHAELQLAQGKMGAGRQTVEAGGRQYATLDMNAFETELIVLSLVDWNLTDQQGVLLPLTPDRARRDSVARLPGSVTSVIFKRCNELNGPQSTREAATFPDEAVGGDPDGDLGSPGAGVVPDPAGLLGEAGADPGRPGVPALA